jgi:hypothetical protein
MVAAKWINLAEHLQESTTTIVATQRQVVEIHQRHDARSSENGMAINTIRVSTAQLKEAGLYACEIIVAMERRLPEADRSGEILDYVEKIRAILEPARREVLQPCQ